MTFRDITTFLAGGIVVASLWLGTLLVDGYHGAVCGMSDKTCVVVGYAPGLERSSEFLSTGAPDGTNWVTIRFRHQKDARAAGVTLKQLTEALR